MNQYDLEAIKYICVASFLFGVYTTTLHFIYKRGKAKGGKISKRGPARKVD